MYYYTMYIISFVLRVAVAVAFIHLLYHAVIQKESEVLGHLFCVLLISVLVETNHCQA